MTASRLLSAASAILILVALVSLVGYVKLPAARHYQLLGDEDSLVRALSQIESGAALSEIEEQLGPAVFEGEKLRLRMIDGHKNMATKRPDLYPDGVTDDDRFVTYPAKPHGITLSVRDEKLINFDPSDFRAGPQPIKMLHK